MHTQKLFLGFLLVSGATVVFFACKKQELSAEPAADQFKTVVDQWKREQSVIVSANSSDSKKLKNIDSIISQLDYTVARTVRKDNSTELYFIKINSAKNKGGRFLSLQVSGGKTIFDGVYESSDINKIVRFYSTKKLPARDSLLVWGIDGAPVKGWETTQSGKQLQRFGFPKSRSQSSTAITGNRTSTASRKINFALAPPPPTGEPCIDWYWVTYDVQTGLVYSESYAFSTGDCDPSHGGYAGPSTSAEQACLQQQEEALANFEATTQGGIGMNYNDLSVDMGSENPLTATKPWVKDWVCLSGWISWNLISHESGELRPSGISSRPYCFSRVQHNGITMVGTVMYGTKVTYSQGIANWSFTESDMQTNTRFAVGIQLTFNVLYTFDARCGEVINIIGATAGSPRAIDYTASAFFQLP